MSDNLAGLGTSMAYPMIPEDRPGSVILISGYPDMDQTNHLPNSSIADSKDPLGGQHFVRRDDSGQLLPPPFTLSLSPEESELQERVKAPSFIQADNVPSEELKSCNLQRTDDGRLREESSSLPENGQEVSDTSSFIDSDGPDVWPETAKRLDSDALCTSAQQSDQIVVFPDDHEQTTTFVMGPGDNQVHNDFGSTSDDARAPSNSTDAEGPVEAQQAKQPQAECSDEEDPAAEALPAHCPKKEGMLAGLDADAVLHELKSVDGPILELVLKNLSGCERPKPLPGKTGQAVPPTHGASSSNISGDTVCPKCGSRFSRPSELK